MRYKELVSYFFPCVLKISRVIQKKLSVSGTGDLQWGKVFLSPYALLHCLNSCTKYILLL